MIHKKPPEPAGQQLAAQLRVIRHNQVCVKLQISSAKLFDMVAKEIFPKPFVLIPGGRAVGWLEQDIDEWILGRKQTLLREVV
jgi:prophage regulatory protein